MEQPKDQEHSQQSPKVRDMISLLESDHNTSKQRRSSSSTTISNTSSIVSMISSGTQVEPDSTTAQLLKKLRDIINGGTTTNTQGGKPKYRAYLKADIANKILDNLEYRIERLEAKTQEPPPPNQKETKESGTNTTETVITRPGNADHHKWCASIVQCTTKYTGHSTQLATALTTRAAPATRESNSTPSLDNNPRNPPATTPIRLLQINLRRSEIATSALLDAKTKFQPNIILVQEPYILDGRIAGIPRSWNQYTSKNNKAGIITLPTYSKPFLLSTSEYSISIKIQTDKGPLTVTSSYSSPNGNIQEATQEIEQLITNLNEESVIIGADSNAHNRLWGYPNEDTSATSSPSSPIPTSRLSAFPTTTIQRPHPSPSLAEQRPLQINSPPTDSTIQQQSTSSPMQSPQWPHRTNSNNPAASPIIIISSRTASTPNQQSSLSQHHPPDTSIIAQTGRLNDIYDDVSESCTHCRVPRALFERWMKQLMGDRSPDERGIDWRTIPPPGCLKEALIFWVYSLTHDRAFDARRKTVMDRDVTWAIRHLWASLNR
ncbi:hypothetical protein HNY73_007064 [Argiope bruennichi]|uniref:Endonuclease/exonuclease/phosphatase domain-containing protein n=1 Tax=Argiope bruennichi TaxID=94029 RepID=A0A8T0FIB6_ARGBR|nr:hypothetical protein HNY73_007064 [Argiope bruennichi]